MTYGFIELPFDLKELENIKKKDVQTLTETKNKITSAFSKAGNAIKNAVTNPTQTFKNLGTYINWKNMKQVGSAVSNTLTDITTKYSGIAITQLLVDGKVTSQSALDYLFLGVAPAINQAGIALGYTSIGQIKRALFDGSINVGQFVGGLTNALKSIYQIAEVDNIKDKTISKNRIYFDMTLSDSSQYQSETPDRRVEQGNDLSEFCHNLPATFDVQAELQDGKRYSKEEFRELLTNLRDLRKLVTLYLGDEHFDNLILQNFSPSGQGSQKGGFEYNLQFKQITVGQIEQVVLTAFATVLSSNISEGTQAIASNSSRQIKSGTTRPNTQNGKTNNVKQQEPKNGASIAKQYYQEITSGKGIILKLLNPTGNMFIPNR